MLDEWESEKRRARIIGVLSVNVPQSDVDRYEAAIRGS